MKKVLLVTRPLIPPWDEASKNFAYFLGKTVEGHALTLMTAGTPLIGLPSSVHEESVYDSADFNFHAKCDLFTYLRSHRSAFDITHYLFTPTKWNTGVIRALAHPTHGHTIQTVATLREDLYGSDDLKAMLFADRITVYTDKTKAKLETLGFSNVDRIYPGIDLEKYQPREKSQAVMQEYSLTPDDFLVVYPGEYTRLGATDFLTETLISYFQKNPASNIKFLFACRIKNEADRAKREAVREAFKKSDYLKHVRFEEGHATSDMAAIYNTADVVAFPVGDLRGKFDVPLIIIEAYASGKPVILSDLSAFDEFSSPEISATIPRLDGPAFIEKILYLKENKAYSDAIGSAARSYAEAHFDLRQTAAEYARLYASL